MFNFDIYKVLRKYAKSADAQNYFNVCKDLHGMRFFNNDCELSTIQKIFLQYIYMYDGIARDIVMEKISKHIYDSEIYEDAYIRWRADKKDNKNKSEDKQKDLLLVSSNKIKFPKEEIKHE